MRPLIVLLLALVVLTAGRTRASANPRPAAKLDASRLPTDSDALEQLKQGNRAVDLGEYDQAIDHYKRGAILDAVPLFYLDLGLAYRKAGRYPDAIDYYRKFLDRSAGDADPDGIRTQVAQLIMQLEAARDAPPTHPAPSAEPTAGASVATSATAQSPTSTPTAISTTSPQVSRWSDGIAWGLGIGGLVSAGVGVGFFVNASSLDDQANRETNFEVRDQLRARASSRRTIGTVTAAAGGVLLVAAVVKFALVPSGPTTSALQLTPGPGDVGVGFAFDF
jgi:tetratricopeptide (TPR) repeat protein